MNGINEKVVKGTDGSWTIPAPGFYDNKVQNHY